MKKAIASLALIIMFSQISRLSAARAQDHRPFEGSLYPPLPPAAQEQMWHGPETDPFWKNTPAMENLRIPGRRPVFPGALTGSILEGMDPRELPRSDGQREALLSGEPQDTSCVMGVRYSFSEFDFSRFCRSIFTFIGAGNTRRPKQDQGFSFYVDSSSP